jgi:hypothetical protein
MKYNVYLTAFKTKADIRVVDVPEGELMGDTEEEGLEVIFHLGQNEFQPLEFPSVSVGDIIEKGDKYFMVRGFGFSEITKEEFDKIEGPLGASAYDNINDIISGVAKK